MEDRHLLLTKDRGVFLPVVISSEVADEILSRDVVRLFGKEFSEEDTLCEWFEVTSVAAGDFVGVCFVDFYLPETDLVVRSLESETTVTGAFGTVVLLREVQSWEVQPGPYLPVHFLREKGGDFCYLVPSVFGPNEKVPQAFGHASTLKEVAEATAKYPKYKR